MLGQKNKSHIVVGKGLDLLAEGSTRNALVVGQIGIFKVGSQTAIDGTTDLTDGDKFRVVFKDVTGEIIQSPVIEYSRIKSKNATDFADSTVQKTAIGFNGTSGAIAVANSAIYDIHVVRRDWSKTWGEHGSFKLAAAYKSTSAATQQEIADALVLNCAKSFYLEKAKSGVEVTKVERLSDAAGVDASGAVTVGRYNTHVVFAVAPNAVVGDYIRIGSVGGGTNLSHSVYKVTGVDGNIVSLDKQVTSPDGTYGIADVDIITGAAAAAGDFGIVLESSEVKFVPGLFKFQNVTFDVHLSEAFGTTPITELELPGKGSGTYEEVAEMEWELRNNQREAYHNASYPVSEPLNAVDGVEYDLIVIESVDANARAINQYELSFMSTIIATDNSAGTSYTQLKDVLGIA